MKKLNKFLSGKVILFIILLCVGVYVGFSFVHKANIIDTNMFTKISLCALFVGVGVIFLKLAMLVYRVSSGQIIEEILEQQAQEENESEAPLNALDQLVEHYYKLIKKYYPTEKIDNVKISTKDFFILYIDNNEFDLRKVVKANDEISNRRKFEIEQLFTNELTIDVVEERLNQRIRLVKYDEKK